MAMSMVLRRFTFAAGVLAIAFTRVSAAHACDVDLCDGDAECYIASGCALSDCAGDSDCIDAICGDSGCEPIDCGGEDTCLGIACECSAEV